MFESVIRDAVVRHLEDNGLLQDSQHGFRKGRSCLTNLLTFMDKVSGNLDSGVPVDTVFLDFAKAFDKVGTLSNRGWLLNWNPMEYPVICYDGLWLGCPTGSREYVLMDLSQVGNWY